MPVPMYRLETFGKLALTGGAAVAESHQRRRLAFLALLAASGERGLSRDQILGYLWPDTAAANGRHSLEQLLHGMRRALGESVFAGVNPVRLNAAAISSDVGEFELAVERGALADAVALYAGPFLHGFYLENAAEFERWTSIERARLAGRYVDALGRLADDADAAGDHSSAVRWRRRLVEADPVSSRFALALMRALTASGDRTAALQHARIYEALVQQELESGPDPSIVAYAAELRAANSDWRANVPLMETAGARNPQSDQTPGRTAHAAPELPAQAVSEPMTSAAAVTRPEPPLREEGVHGARRPYWLLAGIGLAATILLVAALTTRHGEKIPPLDPDKIVIVPFRTTGADSSVKYLGEGVVDLIAPMLTGEGGPTAVDSRTAISAWNRVVEGRDGTAEDARQVARELGAGLALTGSVVAVGHTLTITGSLIRGDGSDTRPLTSVAGPLDSVDTLLDRFVGQLLTRQSGVAETSVSAVTSHSLPAIRAYLSGRAAYRRGDEERAIESFTRALEIDSTFALAALDLAVGTGKLVRTEACRNQTCRVFSMVPGFALSERDDDLFDRAVQLAWRSRSKLGRRDTPLLDALRGENYPRASSARATLADLERAVRVAPDRPESLYLLGVLMLYQGSALGIADSRERAEAAFRAASKLDPSYLAPLARLVDAAAFSHDTAGMQRAGLLYLSRDSTNPAADYVRWVIAAGGTDTAAQRAIAARFHSLSRTTLDHIFLASQMTGLRLEDADSAAALVIHQATDPMEKSVALRRAELLALNRGRPSEATALLRRMDLMGASFNFRTFAIAGALFNDGDRRVADSAARDLARTLARDTLGVLTPDAVRRASIAMVIQSLWYLDEGDTARAAAGADWLRRQVRGQPRNRVLFLLPEMLIASSARRSDGAALRARVDSVTRDGCCEFPEFVMLALARAYEASGDEAGALRVIRRGIWFYPPRQMSTYLREEGKLAARLGDRAGAIRAYEHYLALRSNPEPPLRAERERIRTELQRLRAGR